jgi:very-short-patch-repair endonuclease
LNLPAGVSEWDLRSGKYRRLFQGVYLHSDVPLNESIRVAGALLLCDDRVVVSHHSAARIWGGVVPDDGRVHVSGVGTRRKVRGIRAHRVKVGGQRWREIGGLRVTTPVQTFLDLGTELGLLDLVVLGDSLVRTGQVTPEELVAAVATFRGGSRQLLRRAAGLVRREVDSPMESRLRVLMILAGLPEPTVNHVIRRADGSVRFRFDLSYPGHHLVIEYDGRQHAESDDQWDWDIDRREWMDHEKWRIVIVRSKDLYNKPAQTLQRIISAMRDQGMAVPRLSDEWRLYFPGRTGDLSHPR